MRPKAALNEGRHLVIDPHVQGQHINVATWKTFCSNKIVTSRYTLWDFLPRQLAYQFSKIANIYFLLVAILQMIPNLSSTGRWTTIMPLAIFTMIAIAHEGYDDIRRYRQDKVENNKECRVLRVLRDNATQTSDGDGQKQEAPATSNSRSQRRKVSPYDLLVSLLPSKSQAASENASASVSNDDASHKDVSSAGTATAPPIDRKVGKQAMQVAVESDTDTSCSASMDSRSDRRVAIWQTIKWRDIKVGDFIELSDGEWVPADILVLHAPNDTGSCYVETAALDGETNLKLRQALHATNALCGTKEDLARFEAIIDTEPPNQDLYNFDGRIQLLDDKPPHPLSATQLLLRGSILRNTPYIYGYVIFSGEETKVRKNSSKRARTKAPRLQMYVNRAVIAVFTLLLTLSSIGIGLYVHFRQGRWSEIQALGSSHSPALTFFTYIILLNTLIPISLYVTLEIVKTVQASFIDNDLQMYHEASNTPASAQTCTINEELGQVSYLFSDKTGTLTDNVMVFRKMTVGGLSYQHDGQYKSATSTKVVDIPVLLPADGELATGTLTAAPPSLDQMYETRSTGSSTSVSPIHATANQCRILRASFSVARSPTLPETRQPASLTGPMSPPTVSTSPEGALDIITASPSVMNSVENEKGALQEKPPVVSTDFSGSGKTPHNPRERATLDLQHRHPRKHRKTLSSPSTQQLRTLAVHTASIPTFSDEAGDASHRHLMGHKRGKSSRIVDPELPPTSVLCAKLLTDIRSQHHQRTLFFLLSLSLCHTVVPNNDGGTGGQRRTYSASSPDEKSLISAAAELGFEVTRRTHSHITIESVYVANNEPIDYRVLSVIEFTSARKRMSIVCELPDGRILLICKGADSTVLDLLHKQHTGPTVTARKVSEAAPVANLGHRKAVSAIHGIAARKFAHRATASASHVEIDKLTDSLSVPSALWARHGSHSDDGTSPRSANAKRHAENKAKEPAAEPASSLESFGDHMHRMFAKSFAGVAGAFSDPLDHARFVQATIRDINRFATEGLRTLLYAHRFVTREEYEAWSQVYNAASSAINDRAEQIEEAANMIERDLTLTGATAIEDKLQEGVPETIEKIRRAGIKLWMLTGDKLETAINVGQSCRIIYADSITIVLVNNAGLKTQMEMARRDIRSGKACHPVVVLEGPTLASIEQDPVLTSLLIDIGVASESVICCRVSPAQKSHVVRLIKQRVQQSVTLAIGDGANDIVMIQEAHVGIGITGKEGMQAARAADYSIAQFRFLLRLMFVHGRWSYVRVSRFVLGTFYKNATFYLTQFFFQSYNGFSGTSLYESWSVTVFNTIFSCLPVIFVGVFEQDLSDTTLLNVPELYSHSQRHGSFNLPVFALWMLSAIYQSAVCFYIPVALDGSLVLNPWHSREYIQAEQLVGLSLTVYTCVVFVVTLRIAYLENRNWNLPTHIGAGLSIASWFIWLLLMNRLYSNSADAYSLFDVFYEVASTLKFWAVVVLTTSIAFIPVILGKLYLHYQFPSDVQIYQEMERRYKKEAATLIPNKVNATQI